jgi:hypothetical protein
MVEAPMAATAQLFGELGKHGVHGLRLPSSREIEAFITPDLYREREDRKDLKAHAKSPQLTLFRTLLAGGLPAGETDGGEAVASVLAKYEAGLPPMKTVATKPEETLESLRHRLALADQEIKFNKVLSDRHEADLQQRDGRISALEKENRLAAEHIARSEARIRQADERIVARDVELRAAQGLVDRLEAELRQRDERMGALERENRSAAERIADAEARIRQAEERVLLQDVELHASRGLAERLEAELHQGEEVRTGLERASKAALEAVERQLTLSQERAQADAGEASRTEAKLRRQLDELQGQLASTKQQWERSARDLRSSAATAQRLELDIDMRFRELARLTQLLLGREDELANVQAACAKAEGENREVNRKLDELDRKLAWVVGSRSWRITKPLRFAARLFTGRTQAAAGADNAAQMAMLGRSELFDAAWYLRTYPDVERSGIGAAEHFLLFGAPENRNPGPRFDTAAYLRNNPDVAGSGLNPLVHYIAHGQAEGRRCT